MLTRPQPSEPSESGQGRGDAPTSRQSRRWSRCAVDRKPTSSASLSCTCPTAVNVRTKGYRILPGYCPLPRRSRAPAPQLLMYGPKAIEYCRATVHCRVALVHLPHSRTRASFSPRVPTITTPQARSSPARAPPPRTGAIARPMYLGGRHTRPVCRHTRPVCTRPVTECLEGAKLHLAQTAAHGSTRGRGRRASPAPARVAADGKLTRHGSLR